MKLKDWTAAQRGRALQLARALEVSPPVVSDWCTGKKQVPFEKCPLVERFTDGQVTCEEQRPDKASEFTYLRSRTASEDLPATAPAAIHTVTEEAKGAIRDFEHEAEAALEHVAENVKGGLKQLLQEAEKTLLKGGGASAVAPTQADPDQLPPIDFEESLPPIVFPDSPPAADPPAPGDANDKPAV